MAWLGAWGTSAHAAPRFAVATGNWDTNIWNAASCAGASGATVPAATDDATICDTRTVTLVANTAITNLTINAGGTLNLATFRIRPTAATSISGTINLGSNVGTRFAGLVTLNSGGLWANTANNVAINFRGGLTNNGGAFNAGTGIQTFDTNAQSIGGTSAITIPNVTVTAITLTNNGTLTAGATTLTNSTISLMIRLLTSLR